MPAPAEFLGLALKVGDRKTQAHENSLDFTFHSVNVKVLKFMLEFAEDLNGLIVHWIGRIEGGKKFMRFIEFFLKRENVLKSRFSLFVETLPFGGNAVLGEIPCCNIARFFHLAGISSL